MTGDIGRLRQLEHRIEELERELGRRLDAHETWLHQIVADQRNDAENISTIADALRRRGILHLAARAAREPRAALGKAKQVPARVQRRLARQRLEQRLRAELPEVTEAELARRRAVVAKYVPPPAGARESSPSPSTGSTRTPAADEDPARAPGDPTRAPGADDDHARATSNAPADDDLARATVDAAGALSPSPPPPPADAGGRPQPLPARSVPTADDPVVSVVIPVHGAIDVLLRCLDSLAAHPPSAPFEVIVANDATDPEEFWPVRRVGGIRIVDNDENIGFLLTCNRAVAEARGRFVWLLNSDTEVTAGAADALVATFDRFPDAGAVGSKLVYPDGSLQEAGGIVWRDGSAWNYGRHQRPDLPPYDYARQADYVSAASLMVRRDRWEALGGFDTAFAPAYYEDTDLCLQLHQAGHPVIYQPLSVVVHHEGVSYGTDERLEGKRHQVENHQTFLRKWRSVLAEREPNGTQPERAKERAVRRRVLVIDARMLTPDMDSGSLRMANLLDVLTDLGCRCTFVPDNLLADEPGSTRLRGRGVEVVGRPHARSIEQFLRARGGEFDVVILSRLEVAAAHLTDVRRWCPDATVIYDTVDLHFLRETRQALLTGDDLTAAEAVRDKELAAAARADLTLVCSTLEQELLTELVPGGRVEVVGNIHVATTPAVSPQRRHGVLFVGGFEHPPNVDAITWFVHDVLGWLLIDRPDLTVHVVGSRMVPEVQALAGPNVIVHGHVPDLTELYERCRVVIAPLRYGAGVKGKVTEALARGVPVVGTSMAVEGTPFVNGTHLLVADEPLGFAAAVSRLLHDDDIWQSLSRDGAAALAEHFSTDAAARTLRAVLGLDLVAGRAS